MVLNGFWQIFLAGFFGGLAAEAVGWIELRTCKPEKFPHYFKRWYYWFLTFILSSMGGGLVVLYGIVNVNAILAVNIGASAPLILKGFARTVPPTT